MNLKKGLILTLITIFLTNFNYSQTKLPKIKYKQLQLENGLRVVLVEDKSTPIVAVNIWYHVGSKNETYGKTGYAHLFEHMMFQGSKYYNDDYGKPIQEAGGRINGSTNFDRTRFYKLVPSNFLEMVLYLEAGRMGTLLDVTNQAKLDNQREIVKNEYRQRIANRPYGTAFEKMHRLIYPKTHPYHWLASGDLQDVSVATLADARSFFKKYYVPNNASLVIVGDFDEKQTVNWIKKYFSWIKRGKDIKRPNPKPPKIDGEIRKTYKEEVSLPRQYMIWHTIPASHQDSPKLTILRSILNSRLRNNLVRKNRLSQNIRVGNFRQEISGRFLIETTIRKDADLEETVKQIDSEIEKIKKEPPTAEEVLRLKRSFEAEFIYDMQTIQDKADLINRNNVYDGKPDTFQERLDSYLKITPKDVQNVAKTYLNKNRLIMRIVPGKDENKVAEKPSEDKKELASVKAEDDTDKLPKPQPDPRFTLPEIKKSKLSNGLDVWVVKQNELPIVSMNLVLKTGGTSDPKGKEGLSFATSDLIGRGTTKFSMNEISNKLDLIGAEIDVNAGWDSTNVQMLALTKYFDEALDVYSNSIANSTLPENEIERLKPRWINRIKRIKNNPELLVDSVFYSLIYGKSHPYGRSLFGNENSIKSINRNDLVKFYKTFYRPNNATLIIVGDVESSVVLPKLEKAFAGWKKSNLPKLEIPKAKEKLQPGIYIIDRPKSPQSSISMGQISVPRQNPDYAAIQVLNRILGGQYASRINLNLRADKGYAFGARTRFIMRRELGNFIAFTDVRTDVTKESVIEMIKEINGIKGKIPISEQELNLGKNGLIRGFPITVETVEQFSGRLSDSALYNLPDTFFNDYLDELSKVTKKDVVRVANKYLTPEKMTIVIVGDKEKIEPKLQEIKGYGEKIQYLDKDGNIISDNQK